ncbi:UNKNOWN [Stylonychia lemnae]|uniref:Uncharacterized protein n=1 Tax=Stylonychia lemnae TaxID=5949 RepID=A0A078AQW9_STYLE|nr:UNKNOWN [Stylonychia lemnae]|eukprot:CDW84609.1 UNKNOWN [Stylonychia lemnae]
MKENQLKSTRPSTAYKSNIYQFQSFNVITQYGHASKNKGASYEQDQANTIIIDGSEIQNSQKFNNFYTPSNQIYEKLQFNVVRNPRKTEKCKTRPSAPQIQSSKSGKMSETAVRKVSLNLGPLYQQQVHQKEEQSTSRQQSSDRDKLSIVLMDQQQQQQSSARSAGDICTLIFQIVEKFEDLNQIIKQEYDTPQKVKIFVNQMYEKQIKQLRRSLEFRQLLQNHEQIKLAAYLDASIKSANLDSESFTGYMMQNQTGRRDDSAESKFGNSDRTSSDEQMYMSMPRNLLVLEIMKLQQQIKKNETSPSKHSHRKNSMDMRNNFFAQQIQQQQLYIASFEEVAKSLQNKLSQQAKQFQTQQMQYLEQIERLNLKIKDQEIKQQQLQNKYYQQNEEYLHMYKQQEFKDRSLREYEKTLKKMDEMKIVMNELKKNSKSGSKGKVLKDLVEKMSLIVMNPKKKDEINEKELLLLRYLDDDNSLLIDEI